MAVHARNLLARADYPGAIAAFDKAIALQPQWAALITERAFAREASGDLEGAQVDYDEVLRLAPDHGNSWSHAAWIRALRGVELDRALELINKAQAVAPTVDTLDTAGFVHFRRSEFALALRWYDAAVKKSPRSATTLYMRGVVKRRMGDMAAGDADIAKAVKLNREIAALWTRRAVTP